MLQNKDRDEPSNNAKPALLNSEKYYERLIPWHLTQQSFAVARIGVVAVPDQGPPSAICQYFIPEH